MKSELDLLIFAGFVISFVVCKPIKPNASQTTNKLQQLFCKYIKIGSLHVSDITS